MQLFGGDGQCIRVISTLVQPFKSEVIVCILFYKKKLETKRHKDNLSLYDN